nr:DALR anticodon-binding domain-containing protein [Trichocoleus sp. FACHB-90]
MALWLQFLVNRQSGQSPIPNPQSPIPNPQSLSSFPIQYAHARCCSLLRLGEREGLIRLGVPALTVVEPDVIPWLNEDSIRLVYPAERALIAQVLGLLDELDGWGQPDWVKLAIALSQTWESFYSECRIFGEVKTQTPHLAQARLGLVAATRSILRSLLQNRLFILAPVEL